MPTVPYLGSTKYLLLKNSAFSCDWKGALSKKQTVSGTKKDSLP